MFKMIELMFKISELIFKIREIIFKTMEIIFNINEHIFEINRIMSFFLENTFHPILNIKRQWIYNTMYNRTNRLTLSFTLQLC